MIYLTSLQIHSLTGVIRTISLQLSVPFIDNSIKKRRFFQIIPRFVCLQSFSIIHVLTEIALFVCMAWGKIHIFSSRLTEFDF